MGSSSKKKNRNKKAWKKLDTAKESPSVDDSEFKDNILNAHNEHRKNHNVPLATWSNSLAENAQNWATTIANKGKFEHSKPNQRQGQGENIACAGGQPLTAEAAIKMWYDEIKDYDFTSKPTYNPNCGHFSQMVWAASTEIGAGRATDKKGMHYVVVRYSPAGNNLDEFEQNIKPPAPSTEHAAPPVDETVAAKCENEVCSAPETSPVETSLVETNTVETGPVETSTVEKSEETNDEAENKEVLAEKVPPKPTISFPNTSETSKVNFKLRKAEENHTEKLDRVTTEVVLLHDPVRIASYHSRTDYVQPGKSYSVIHYEY